MPRFGAAAASSIPDGYSSHGLAEEVWCLTTLESAGHLEMWYGDELRRIHADATDAQSIKQCLLLTHRVSAPDRVIQKWVSTQWSAKGRLVLLEEVEERRAGCAAAGVGRLTAAV